MKKFVILNTKTQKYTSSIFFLSYSTHITPMLTFSDFENAIIFNESFFEETVMYTVDGLPENKRSLILKYNPNLVFKEVIVELKNSADN